MTKKFYDSLEKEIGRTIAIFLQLEKALKNNDTAKMLIFTKKIEKNIERYVAWKTAWRIFYDIENEALFTGKEDLRLREAQWNKIKARFLSSKKECETK